MDKLTIEFCEQMANGVKAIGDLRPVFKHLAEALRENIALKSMLQTMSKARERELLQQHKQSEIYKDPLYNPELRSEWIEWKDSECPEELYGSQATIEIKQSDGKMITMHNAPPESYWWRKDGLPCDIIAYRVIATKTTDD